jgi:leucyl-tRNA---protein transferase
MKYSFTELKPDYQSYNFPYNVSAYFEEGDQVSSLLNLGLLPTRTSDTNKFYMGRSIRVDLNKFELSSENRRIINKTGFIDFKLLKLSDFPFDYKIQKFCKDYFDNRFGKGKMSAQAIKRIFTSSWNNMVYVVTDNTKPDSQPIGYATMYHDEKCEHYAYPFYDLEYFKTNIGARMILNAVINAKENGKQYIYLGTIYEKSALYKTEFKGVQWWDGNNWSDDIQLLKDKISEQHVEASNQ